MFKQKDDLSQLATCHPDLQRVFEEVAKSWNIAVVYGHRTVKEQQALYALGRTRKGSIVTRCDGVNKMSKHNYKPSMAVDVVVWGVLETGRWMDTDKTHHEQRLMAIHAKRVAQRFRIDDFEWGGDWTSFKDTPHFQLSRKVDVKASLTKPMVVEGKGG